MHEQQPLELSRPQVRTPLLVAAALMVVVVGVATLSATSEAADASLTWGRAAVLGVVEGATEYVPVSSTGHLLVSSRLLGLPSEKGSAGLDAANTYAIAIQFGAILAVAGLFWRRLRDMALGLIGRSESGRHTLITLTIAFVPAAVLGAAFDSHIESLLFGPWPVIAAWVAGGILILALEASGRIPRQERQSVSVGAGGDTGVAQPSSSKANRTDPLLQITYRRAAIIGLAQCLALWPGTSRSLATIVAALLLGVSMAAAVEFSFLLGFLTLGAATAFKLLTDGGTLVEQFGVLNPVIGAIFAFVSAVAAIRWMIGYLQHHELSIFAWYRFAAAAVTIGLLAFSVI